mmetsp:Transcript_5823/g.12742  ORF Transcript_5823/g.12742 Transcript_5823/m.12742 type:complete len:169 (+) Transcript_5823:146-652(+)
MTSTLDLANRHYTLYSTGIDLSSAKAPSIEDREIYTAAMLVCSAADGDLHEEEEKWIVGHQAAFGVPQSILDNVQELKTKWTYDEIVVKIKESSTLKFTRRIFVLHILTACGADSELAPEEMDSIRGVASALDLPEDQFEELLELYNQQQEVNKKLMKCLWKESNPYE